MENLPRSLPHRNNQQRHSIPAVPIPTAITSTPTQQHPRRHSYHHHHHQQTQGRRYASHRLSNASNSTASSFASYYSTLSSSSLAPSFPSRPFNTFEIVFTNIVDALIFTSAIAITAYNYWMGYIVDPPRIYGPLSKPSSSSSSSSSYSSPSSPSPSSPSSRHTVPYPSSSASPCLLIKKLDIPSPPPSLSPSSPSSPLPSSSGLPPPTNATWISESWSDLKRTDMEVPVPQTQQNVSSNTETHHVTLSDDDGPHEEEEEEEEEEDRVNRMEETLQELIRQGQAALTTPIDWQ
ncbi:hypothetical protein [Absidia glauca]|uniref:Uncharacterized protein n=1 Tax=Absidia glauca TaxID=4829 RepID=A0A163IZ02_ABSGL|nr:hypothetical protein [Absidia glauca]